MGFMITSEVSKQYLLEEDAVKGFGMAVTNGQSRLALSIMVDVVNGFMEVFNAMMDEDEVDQPSEVEQPQKQETQVEKKIAEKKKPEVKTETKPETLKETKNEAQ
jgi:hypothetical protein